MPRTRQELWKTAAAKILRTLKRSILPWRHGFGRTAQEEELSNESLQFLDGRKYLLIADGSPHKHNARQPWRNQDAGDREAFPKIRSGTLANAMVYSNLYGGRVQRLEPRQIFTTWAQD